MAREYVVENNDFSEFEHLTLDRVDRNGTHYYTDCKCPKCGGEIVIKKTQKGRRYYGCENNPECDVMTWQKPSNERCPKCGGMMLEKGSKLVCADNTCGYIEKKEK